MSKIRDIEEFISREFANLKKSVNKPKTLETIVLKEQTLDNLYSEYIALLKSRRKEFEQTGSWNAQYEKYEITKIKHEGCKQLLAKAIISDKIEDNC